MQHFPVFLVLRGRKVLVLGDGEVAARKAAPLIAAGAEVIRAARFDPSLLEGCAFAVGADAPEAALHALSDAATARGIPVNIVDRPALCSCIMPAIVDRDPVTIAISTGGAAPVLARILRARIEAALPPRIGRLAAIAAEFTPRLRAAWPNVPQRRRILERIFGGVAAERAFEGDEAGARAAIMAELGLQHPAGGEVHFVGTGPGDADLVTMRAHRLLGEADTVVHQPAMSAAILALVRRDATCVCVAETLIGDAIGA